MAEPFVPTAGVGEYILLNYVALGIQVVHPNGQVEPVRTGLAKLHLDYCQVLNETRSAGKKPCCRSTMLSIMSF